VALPPLANPDAPRHRRTPCGLVTALHEVADDLLVNQLEVIQLDQLAEIPLGQLLLNAEHIGALLRRGPRKLPSY
jgi:hypothetical protein